jgi:hypothetical protein
MMVYIATNQCVVTDFSERKDSGKRYLSKLKCTNI